jgi:hypothetical protein
MTRWNRAILVVWLIGARVWRRLAANRGVTANALNFIRAMSSSRIRYQAKVAHLIKTDLSIRRYVQGETTELAGVLQEVGAGHFGIFVGGPVGALNRHKLANQPPRIHQLRTLA